MKYIPAIGTLLMTIHCGCLLAGYNPHVLEYITGFPLTSMFMFFALSRQFHLCWLHKHLIGYLSVMEVCIFLQAHDLLGSALTPMRWIMFVIGLILVLCCLARVMRAKLFRVFGRLLSR